MYHSTTVNNDENGSRPALQIDFEFYARFLEETDATEDQKRELILILWDIAVSFVELGFGVHGVQQICEQDEYNRLNIDEKMIDYLKADTDCI